MTFVILIFSSSPSVYAQNDSFSPFSSLDKNSSTGKSDLENPSFLDQSQRPSQTENPGFQPVFQTMDPKSSDSSNMSSLVGKQNETYQQTSSSSFPRHPREPLTQYQTVVGPARTLTVQPNVYPPGINVPGTTGTTGIGGTTIFPQSTLAGTGTLPQSAVTFPPSVFPPTTSFIPPTSIAPVVGPLSPWFPSIPAIACGGTFTFSVVGSLDRDNDNGNDDNNGDNKNKNGKIIIIIMVIKTSYMLSRFSQMEAPLLIPILLKERFLLVRKISRGTMVMTSILRMFLTIVKL